MLGALVLHSTLPVLEVCCLGTFGVVLARKGILSVETRKGLTKLVFYLFVPAFIFVKIAASVSLHRLVEWWPLVFNMAVSIAMGLGLGRLMVHITAASESQRPILMAAAGLGNAGNIPLVLLVALMREGGITVTHQEADRGLAYILLGMMVASLTHYTIGSHLLGPADGLERLDSGPDEGSVDGGGALQGRKAGAAGGMFALQSIRSTRGNDDRILLFNAPSSAPAGPFPYPAPAYTTLPSERDPPVPDTPLPYIRSGGGARARACELLGVFAKVAGPSIRHSVSPPTVACVLALLVGVIPPLKALVFHRGRPLSIVRDSLSMYGDCAIPCMMLLLGATLHSGPGTTHVPARHIIAIVLCRQVLLPLLGTALVSALLKAGAFACPDPLFLLALLLQHTAPTAVNLHSLAGLHGSGEGELAALLFWQYVASLVTVPCCLMLYLRLVQQYCPMLPALHAAALMADA